MTRKYSLTTVEKYLNDYNLWKNSIAITGALIDTIIIDHGWATEIFEPVYDNEWSSSYIRHKYVKRTPKRFVKMIEDYYGTEEY